MSQLGAIKLGIADSLPVENGGQNQSISSITDINVPEDHKKKGFFKGKLKDIFTSQAKNLFTKQGLTSFTAGGATAMLVKSAALAFAGTTGAPIIVSAVAAAALSGGAVAIVKYYLDRHFAHKRGEEFDAFFSKNTWKKIAFQAGIGALGGSAFLGVSHVFGDQISAVAAKAFAPVAPYVNQAMDAVVKTVGPALTSIGGFFTKIFSSAPVPAPAPAPVAAFVPPVSVEPAVVAPVELPPLPAPTLENALPQIDAPTAEVAPAEFIAKMPELSLPADAALPEFDAPAPEAVTSNAIDNTLPSLEDAVPKPVVEPAQVILATPSALERANDMLKGQKLSSYLQERLIEANKGNLQAMKDVGHELYNNRALKNLPGSNELAKDLFRLSGEGGNMQGKTAYAYATSAKAPAAAPVTPVAPRPVVQAAVTAPSAIQSTPAIEVPKAIAPVVAAPVAPATPATVTSASFRSAAIPSAPSISPAPGECIAVTSAHHDPKLVCNLPTGMLKVGDDVLIKSMAGSLQSFNR